MSGYASLLAARSRLTLADTLYIVETAPKRYRVYPIPKKNGGERIIAHPSRELKTVQRSLVELFSNSLPVHGASTAYEKESSIFDNANRHAGAKWLVKLDIRNFFNSIHPEDWQKFLKERKIDDELIELSSKTFFWKPRLANRTCLSVGAPSSPYVVNRIMYGFDNALALYCNESGMAYTRYADDLAFSASEQMDFDRLTRFVSEELEKIGQLALNENKCRQIGPGGRKSVTGLILANDGRVTLGRKRRRLIEAQLFRFLNDPQANLVDEVRGHLAFMKLADRNAYNRLMKRFGGDDVAKEHKLFSA